MYKVFLPANQFIDQFPSHWTIHGLSYQQGGKKVKSLGGARRPKTTRWRIMKALHNERKKTWDRDRNSNPPLVHTDPLVHPNPQCTVVKKTIKSLLSPFDFYFQIALHQEIYETSERWAGP